MLVKATMTGFWGGARRRTGETFKVPAGTKLGKWMVEVGKVSEGAAPASAPAPAPAPAPVQ